MSIITLLTDFGNQDVYVGIMKGVIAQIAPTVVTVDLTHHIPPQNVLAARFNLLNSYRYFPTGTVHLAVVDPGVGTARRAIAVQSNQGYFVAPNNGILSGVLAELEAVSIVSLENHQYWRTTHPSQTFHGRDIFAPVAAHLALGTPLKNFGPSLQVQELVQLPMSPWQRDQRGIVGVIQYIDHFGNLITNIPATQMTESRWSAYLKDNEIPGVSAYGEVKVGALLSLVGSHGWVEMAVNGGSAAQQLQARVGDPVRLVLGNG